MANLQRRASELQRKICRGVIVEAMRVHPWTIGELMSKLESLSLITTDEKGTNKLQNQDGSVAKLVAPKSFQAEASESKKNMKREPQAPFEDPDTPCLDDVPAHDKIPSKYWTIDSLSLASCGQQILSVMEPAILSTANLRQITVRGQSLWNQQQHTRILEFLTGLPPSFGLAGPYRQWTVLQNLCKDLNESRGRRGKDMVLPYDFEKSGNGLYCIVRRSAKEVTVEHNFLKRGASIKICELPPHKAHSDLYVSNNWSETRAAISSKTHADKTADFLLLPLFPQQEVAPRKRMLALEDGPEEEEGAGGSVCEAASSSRGGRQLKPEDFRTPTPKAVRRKREVSSLIGQFAKAAKADRSGKKRRTT